MPFCFYRYQLWIIKQCGGDFFTVQQLKFNRATFFTASFQWKTTKNFSELKTIKSEKSSLLNNQQLVDLLRLNADVIPLERFDADLNVDLWWQDIKHRMSKKAL